MYSPIPDPLKITFNSAKINKNCAPGAWVDPKSLPNPVNNGNWITSDENASCETNVKFGYRFFRLTLNLPSTCAGKTLDEVYKINFTGYVDNEIKNVYLNGVAKGISGGDFTNSGRINFQVNGPWKIGVNYIDILVWNYDVGGAINPYGLLLVADYASSSLSDIDNDGIKDIFDKCPCEIGQDLNGCKVLDSDKDGISDEDDIDDDNDGVLDIDETQFCSNDNTLDQALENGNAIFQNCMGSVDGPGVNFFGSNVKPYKGDNYIGFHQIEGFSISLPNPMMKGNLFKLEIATSLASITPWGWSSNYPTFVNIYASNGNCQRVKYLGKTTIRQSVAEGWFNDHLNFIPDDNYTHLYFEAISPNTSGGFVEGIGYILIDGLSIDYCEQKNDTDTDTDGIVNRLDLDSDGDGCSDAFESGATLDKTPNYAFKGPYGNNGLQDDLESSAESGIVNYSSKYTMNAVNKTIMDCSVLDSDKDGISDEEDIDDDNDGVLDFDEGVCNNVYQGYVPNEFQVFKYDLGAAYYKTPTNLLPKNKLSLSAIYKCVVPGQINWPLTYADNHVRSYIPSNQISYKNGYSSESNVNITIFRVIVPKGYNNVQQSITRFQADGGSNIWKNSQLIADMCCGDEGGPSGPLTTDYFVNTNDTIEFRSVNGLPFHQSTNFEFKKILGKCVVPDDIDTDGDGVVNRLDLDSDGDGCGDAYESGATKNKSVTFFIGNVGKNGLVDSLESIVDTGVYNYDNTYKVNALDKNIIICTCDLPTNLKFEHNTYCNDEEEKLMLKTGQFNSYTDGSFSSFPLTGLAFNSLTGSVTPKMSSPGEYVLNYNVPQKGNCPSFTLSTNIFKINSLPIINAGIDTSVCFGSPAILKAKGAVNYQWDNGVDDKKSFTPQETKIYKVIGTDANGCKNSDEVEVKVNPNPDYELIVTDPCEKQTLAFTVNLSNQTSSVGVKSSIWTGGSNFTSSELNPQISNVGLKQKGIYYLTLTDNNNCQTQKSITANVSPEDQIDFADLGAKCLNDIIFTLPEPNIKGGSWSTNDNTSIQDEKQGLFNPSKSQPNSEKKVEVTYTTSSVLPTRKCPSQKTKTIIINSLPSIDGGKDTIVCFGTIAILKANGGISYQWDNGIEDKKSFITQATKVYKVIGTDVNGCKNSDEVEVKVNPNPEFELSVNDPCEKQTLAFSVNLGVQTTSVGVKSSIWSGGTNFTSNELNPQIPNVALSQKGSYSLTLTDNNNCQIQKSIIANVSPEDQIDFADLGSKCVNDLIFSLPIVNIKGGSWYSNDNTSIQDEKNGLFDPSKSKPNSDKKVEVTYTSSTIVPARKCPSQKTKIIIINPIPDSMFYSLEQVICEQDAISFKVLNPNMYAKYFWEFGDGTKKEGLNPIYTYIRDGLFTVKLTSFLGDCKVQQVKNEYIKVIPKPKDIDFIPNVIEIDFYNPDVEFNTYTKGKYYEWSFGDETGSTEQNPKHKYSMVPGSYLVTLRVSNMENHCDQSVAKVLLMPEPLVYFIPNTFSPNGDEINNVFQPIFTYGYDPERYSFYVYNRWGLLVFESHNTTIGWDGTFGNELASNDTYVWKLEFKEKSVDRMHSVQGTVNLLR
ncbi:MAG: gliding motility-associated C-terminal domain-containing protein [Crocinitomicaceae bacterium]|nr:gliding motility-associated C-terminal domain-containing protein [Crocinitomicaceae bacterium]